MKPLFKQNKKDILLKRRTVAKLDTTDLNRIFAGAAFVAGSEEECCRASDSCQSNIFPYPNCNTQPMTPIGFPNTM
jgi:hypothetical protein